VNSILQVRLKDVEGGIVRLLGLLRRRGYEVVELSANRSKDKKCFDLVVVIESSRSPQVLVRQMARMLEVEQVRLYDSGAEASNAQPPGASPAGH